MLLAGTWVGSVIVNKCRVALVNRHPLLLDGMSGALSAMGEYSLIARSELLSEAIDIAKIYKPDILVLDPGDSARAFETITTLARLSGGPKVVVLTAATDIEHAIRSLDAGAVAYLTMASSSGELLECIQTVVGGDTYISPCISTQLIASLRISALKKVAPQNIRLTVREGQIVGLLHKGKTNKEIAAELGLSEKTVKHYMTVLMHKMAARSRLEVVLALKEFDPAISPLMPRSFN
jgi:DNA-binding NarL/FixJ family response regulator